MTREDRLLIPKDTCLDLTVRAGLDIQKYFKSRIAPVSTLGSGRAGLAKKVDNDVSLVLMEVNSQTEILPRRRQVKNICSDQGTEKGINEAPYACKVAPQTLPPEHDDNFLYPCSVWMPGHLHLLFNALEEAVTGLDGYKEWLTQLRSLQNFLCDQQLRRKFQHLLLGGTGYSEWFDAYSVVHIDWRWEMLSKALTKLIPLFAIMELFWDEGVMLSSDSGTPLDSNLIKSVTVVLKSRTFVLQCEIVFVHGIALEKFAHTLEGCLCHAKTWTLKVGRKRKLAEVRADTGADGCCWKGKMGPWMAVKGLPHLKTLLSEATSERLQQRLDAETNVDRRATMLGMQLSLRTALIAVCSDKLSFWGRGVYRALGGFYGEVGGDVAVARGVIRDSMQEYEDAVQAGRRHLLHRVFRLLFQEGSAQRLQFAAFARGDGDRLRDFPRAFILLQTYAFSNLVERRIEQLHAILHLMLKNMKHVLPPYACAKLRERDSMELLRHDRAFWDLCVREWRRRNLHAHILALRLPREEVSKLTPAVRCRRIYQCSLEDEYAKLDEERLTAASWKAATVHLRSLPIPIEPAEWKMGIAYFKKLMDVGGYFSIPSFFLDRALHFAQVEDRSQVFAQAGNPVSEAIVATDDVPVDMPWESLPDMAFFVVKHLWPEKRTHVPHAHLYRPRSTIQVCRCQLQDLLQHGLNSVTLAVDAEDTLELDMFVWAQNMRQVMGSLRRWALLRYTPQYEFVRPALADVQPLPAIVDGLLGTVASSSSSSTAIVPADPLGSDATMAFVVACVGQGATAGGTVAIPFRESGLQAVHVRALHSAGALEVCPRDNDVELRLVRSAVAWQARVEVLNPRLAMLVPPEGSLMQCSKLDLMVRLRLEGWGPWPTGVAVEDWAPERALRFLDSDRRPLSYFAALLSRFRIIDKGAEVIPHTRPDAFYRALLCLPATALALMLSMEDGEDMTNQWYTKRIVDCPGAKLEPGSDEEVEPPPTDDLVALLDRAPPTRPRPERARWMRQECDLGPGTPVVRVFFDHASPSGIQKGFCPCDWSGACRWHQCTLFPSLEAYCAAMYAWHKPPNGAEVGEGREGHMRYKPPASHVAFVQARMRLRPF